MSLKIPNEYIKIDNNTTILKITSKKYGVFEVLIDTELVNKCKEFHWSANRFKDKKHNGKHYFYFVSNKVGLLHRFITEAPKGCVVDHINGNTLNNKIENLQICDRKTNSRKARKSVNNKSGVIGVCYCNTYKRWKAAIKVDGKTINLGYFNDIESAKESRRKAEREYFGEHIPIDNREDIIK